MIDQEKAFRILKVALSLSTADETAVSLTSEDLALTRFANSEIHQNVEEHNTTVRVQTIWGKRMGVASSNDLSPAGLKEVVSKSMDLARYAPENPDFPGLLPPEPVPEFHPYSPDVENFTPTKRAEAVKTFVKIARASHLSCAGYVSVSSSSLAFGNSRGVRLYARYSPVNAELITFGETSSGYVSRFSHRLRDFNFEEMAQEAVQKTLQGSNPVELPPEEYPVILDTPAVVDILTFMAFYGFNARAVQEKKGFLTDRLGEQIFSPLVHIVDDYTREENIGIPFDFEGAPRQKVILVEKGVAKNLVYDSITASREGKKTTGHALPPPNTWGPIPMNMIFLPGDTPKSEMLRSVQKGLWVTRFHYTNTVDPRKFILTGMTRDGTFWIENGQMAHGVKNLRFTQNILDAFRNISMVSREAYSVGGEWYKAYAPAVKIDSFTFTSATLF